MRELVATYEIDNGPACQGEGAVYDNGITQYGVDRIAIVGRYPDVGRWAQNNGMDEVVKVVEGSGVLECCRLDGITESELSANEGTNVTVERGEWFAWRSLGESALVLEMLTTPPFDPGQYRVVDEAVVLNILNGAER